MRIEEEVQQLLNKPMSYCETIVQHLEIEGFDFSECTDAEFNTAVYEVDNYFESLLDNKGPR